MLIPRQALCLRPIGHLLSLVEQLLYYITLKYICQHFLFYIFLTTEKGGFRRLSD